MPPANSEILRQAIPEAKLEVIPDAGHLFFIEAPERTRALLIQFLLATG